MCDNTNHYALKLQFFIGTIGLINYHATFVTSLWQVRNWFAKFLSISNKNGQVCISLFPCRAALRKVWKCGGASIIWWAYCAPFGWDRAYILICQNLEVPWHPRQPRWRHPWLWRWASICSQFVFGLFKKTFSNSGLL